MSFLKDEHFDTARDWAQQLRDFHRKDPCLHDVYKYEILYEHEHSQVTYTFHYNTAPEENLKAIELVWHGYPWSVISVTFYGGSCFPLNTLKRILAYAQTAQEMAEEIRRRGKKKGIN